MSYPVVPLHLQFHNKQVKSNEFATTFVDKYHLYCRYLTTIIADLLALWLGSQQQLLITTTYVENTTDLDQQRLWLSGAVKTSALEVIEWSTFFVILFVLFMVSLSLLLLFLLLCSCLLVLLFIFNNSLLHPSHPSSLFSFHILTPTASLTPLRFVLPVLLAAPCQR